MTTSAMSRHVHFLVAITAHNIPMNSTNAEGKKRSFAALSTVFWEQSDFSGGRGSVITGTGTSKSGFFVSWWKKRNEKRELANTLQVVTKIYFPRKINTDTR